MGRLNRWSLPLLAKELVEMSARPRTYLVRVVYAAILLLISWVILYSTIPAGATSPLDVLGRGVWVMQGVGYLQNVGLQLVLPAIACGVFTTEKERNTLSLLFLTRLGPWTILFEKLVSRLLLSFSFLIISAPVLGFCYALGGITAEHLLTQFLGLCITALYIVSISVMCSAYFRTTSAALLGTYFLIYLARLGMTFLMLLAISGINGTPPNVLGWQVVWGVIFTGTDLTTGAALRPFGGSPLQSMAIISIPWLLLSLLTLLLARRYLVSRAFLQPRNPLRDFFRRLDRLFDRANNNALTRGIVVIRPKERLPEYDPVAWRETTTRSMGQTRYLIRCLVVLEVPVLIMLLRYATLGDTQLMHVFSTTVQILVWVGMTLLTCVLSAGLISGERGRQTLDVLLVTPLNSRDIVQQKMAGVMRLIWICEAPLWTCVVFRYLLDENDQNLLYVICQATMLLIYPRLVAWVAMWHGMHSKTALAAVVKSLLAVLWRCLGPYLVMYILLILFFINGPGRDMEEFLLSLTWLSPITLFFVSEYINDLSRHSAPVAFTPPLAWFMSTIIHGGMLAYVWWRCLDRADSSLGRSRRLETSAPLESIFNKPNDPIFPATGNL